MGDSNQMMKRPGRTAQLFLQGLNEKTTRETFEQLASLIESLEEKNDPEMTEVRLVESIYSFMEKMKLLESNLRSYVSENAENLPSNKLANLYEEISYNGGSIYRD